MVHHGERIFLSYAVIDYTRQLSDWISVIKILAYILLIMNKMSQFKKILVRQVMNRLSNVNEFVELYASANEELYPGCDYVTRLDFMAKFTYFKVKGKLTDSIFNEILEFFQHVFPITKGYKLPPSYYAIKKTFKTIGLGYESIHACVNDCFLFRGDNNKDLHFCPVCKTSRWKDSNTPGKKVPKKVLRYFPIIPRLQRLYKSSHTAKEMTWHATGKCTEPVRLRLAVDGFNPFGNLSQAYSMWPVILTTYNLPPWLCIKESSFMLTLLIPGPKSLGKDIDVYLRPLIDDLKVLWALKGVETIDVATGQKFNMRAMVLWTINDFPARSSLSGWSGQGYKACPTCNEDTPSVRVLGKTAYVGHRRFLKKPHKWRRSLEFNGEIEDKDPPRKFDRDQIQAQLARLPTRVKGKHPSYGGVKIKRNVLVELNWTKRSIFYELAILNTLLMNDKSKDTAKARQDLKRLGIRSGLWLGQTKNGKCSKPQAAYSFSPENRKKFCQFIKGVKLPDGFGSNFKHKVTDNDTNIIGLKSHDCHIMMQRLLPYGLQQYLPDEVAKPIIKLCSFFKQICSATLMEDDMLKAQSKVVDILCNLELIYPPAFFDIMIHLVIHLPLEALEGGPIRPRWMFPFERFMKKLKGYVRNKAKPEGSIAEGYVAEEALTFSSHYFRDVTTKFNRPDRNVDPPPPTCQFQVFRSLCKSIGLRSVIRFDAQELKKVIWFVVHNRDERRTTQNSGICSPGGNDGEMYYGQLQEILEFSYLSFKVVLFRVKWFDTRNEGRKVQRLVLRNNMTQILTKDEAFKDDQYILATQVKQCFYLEDMARRPPHWKVVEHVNHKKFSDGGVIVVEEDPDVIHFDNSSDLPLSTSLNDLNNATLHIDGQSTEVDAPPDIIDLDEDDDIIDDEDALPHDLADSDDEDLVNVEDDDGVEVMSTDVARGHGGDGGGDDRPPSHHIPTGCGGCFANRGKGTRKANLGGRKAGRLHTRQETRNLGLKKITDDKGPVPIRFEWDDKKTMMPLGGHASHWSNYLGELIREMPLYYPSWQKVPAERKAAIVTKIRTQFDLTPHMQSQRWADINAGIQQHLQKLYNTNKASLKAAHWVINPETGTYDVETIRQGRPESITPADWDAQIAFWNDPRNQARAAQNRQNRAKSTVVCRQGSRSLARLRDEMMASSETREYPSLIDTFFVTHTVNGVFIRDEDRAIYEEMVRLRALGSNTESGVPYTDEEINAMARKGKQRRHLPGVGRVLRGRAIDVLIPPPPPPPQCTHNSGDVEKLKKKNKYLTKQVNLMTKLFRSDDKFSQMLTQYESTLEFGSGCGDDEIADDEDGGEDEEDEEDDDEDGGEDEEDESGGREYVSANESFKGFYRFALVIGVLKS
ncbi:hypothetical protein Tco_1336900 [Tanacetum coccineum]